jgi:hypothetical protein
VKWSIKRPPPLSLTTLRTRSRSRCRTEAALTTRYAPAGRPRKIHDSSRPATSSRSSRNLRRRSEGRTELTLRSCADTRSILPSETTGLPLQTECQCRHVDAGLLASSRIPPRWRYRHCGALSGRDPTTSRRGGEHRRTNRHHRREARPLLLSSAGSRLRRLGTRRRRRCHGAAAVQCQPEVAGHTGARRESRGVKFSRTHVPALGNLANRRDRRGSNATASILEPVSPISKLNPLRTYH